MSDRSSPSALAREYVVVGRFAGAFGVRGWLRAQSFTRPQDGLVDYRPWWVRGLDGWREIGIEGVQRHSRHLLIKPCGCDDRDSVLGLIGQEIAVLRSALPDLAQDEYYWADLVGLRVVTTAGVDLGHVDHLLETGANDVLVVRGDRLRMLPFDPDGVIRRIDLATRVMEVDWDPTF